jgi:hypothetical protein
MCVRWIDLHGWLAKAASSVGFERLLFATPAGAVTVWYGDRVIVGSQSNFFGGVAALQ